MCVYVYVCVCVCALKELKIVFMRARVCKSARVNGMLFEPNGIHDRIPLAVVELEGKR